MPAMFGGVTFDSYIIYKEERSYLISLNSNLDEGMNSRGLAFGIIIRVWVGLVNEDILLGWGNSCLIRTSDESIWTPRLDLQRKGTTTFAMSLPIFSCTFANAMIPCENVSSFSRWNKVCRWFTNTAGCNITCSGKTSFRCRRLPNSVYVTRNSLISDSLKPISLIAKPRSSL